MVQYSYDSGQNRNRLNKITFANGDYTSYIYSEDGNITEIKSFSSENVLLSAYRYSYNELGGVSKIQNIAENTEVRYGAEGGKAFVLLNADGSADDEVLHSKNAGENDEMLENLGSVQYIETKGLPVSDSDAGTTTNKKSIVSPLQKYDFSDTSDYFGRTKTKKARTTINSPDLEGTGIGAFFDYDVEFAYKDVNIGRTSTLVESYKTSLSLRSDVVNESLLGDTEFVAEEVPYTENEYFYSYDSEGNITRIEKKIAGIGDSVQTTLLAGYVYDSVGQVVRENNAQQQKTYTYIYDESGNIVERKEYAFTEGNLGEVLSTRTFGYDNVWKDKLTSCGATQITTDALGNPTTTITKDILGEEKVAALEWNGRQLSSATIGLQRYEYSYNSDGLRTCVRTYNDGVLEQSFYYVWENEKLSGYIVKDDEGNEQYVVKLLYDNTGDSIGYEFYDVAGDKSYTMYFQKNLQGDITGVYSIEYGEILTYSYDAWGNVSIDYLDASVNEVIASMTAILYTPITYRGYMYDPFTGMYYLQSRYYNPSICRFLNVDDTDILEATQGTAHGANLFAYCNNNPINRVDRTGYLSIYEQNSDGSYRGWVGVGVQICVVPSIMHFGYNFGAEAIRFFPNNNFNNYNTPWLYKFGGWGASISFNVADLVTALMFGNPLSLISSLLLNNGAGITIVFTVFFVFAKNFTSPKNYEGPFLVQQFNLPVGVLSVAHDEKNEVLTIGFGVTIINGFVVGGFSAFPIGSIGYGNSKLDYYLWEV